jgi:hypothetical protein
MASIINASTSGVGGVITTADNSGNLNIQSGGSTKIAVTSAGVAVTGLAKASLPTGSVLQVVTASVGGQVSNSTTTYADTNLTATITPTSATSKVLVLIDQGIFVAGGAAVGYGFQTNMGIKLVRGATDLVTPASDSGGKYTLALSTGAAPASGTIGVWGSCNIIYLDSPATTSATTYKTQLAKGTTGMGTAYANGTTGTSTITLLEIAA